MRAVIGPRRRETDTASYVRLADSRAQPTRAGRRHVATLPPRPARSCVSCRDLARKLAARARQRPHRHGSLARRHRAALGGEIVRDAARCPSDYGLSCRAPRPDARAMTHRAVPLCCSRPKTVDDVSHQDEVVSSLRSALKEKNVRAAARLALTHAPAHPVPPAAPPLSCLT